MSLPIALDSLPLSRASRAKLTRAGFHTASAVAALKPTQLAHELGVPPDQALAILQEIRRATTLPALQDAVAANVAASVAATPAPAVNGTAAAANGSDEKENAAGGLSQAAVAASLPSHILRNAAAMTSGDPMKLGENALEMMRRRAQLRPIATLCPDFDEMLGGGVPVGQITEFCGVPGAGKTQLCIQLACNVQVPKKLNGSWEGEAVYIDTEGSFLASRAASLAAFTVETMQRRYDALAARAAASNKPFAPFVVPNAEALLKGIHVYRAYDHVEQLATIKALPAFLAQHPNVHLLIIDSVASHFRRGFTDMSLRSRLLTGMAQELLHLASVYQLAVVVTNQVTTRIGSDLSAAALSPALGESWSHSCTHRLMLDWEGSVRVARLLKSPSMRATRIAYDITERGVTQKQAPTPPTQSSGTSSSSSVPGSASASNYHPHTTQPTQHTHGPVHTQATHHHQHHAPTQTTSTATAARASPPNQWSGEKRKAGEA